MEDAIAIYLNGCPQIKHGELGVGFEGMFFPMSVVKNVDSSKRVIYVDSDCDVELVNGIWEFRFKEANVFAHKKSVKKIVLRTADAEDSFRIRFFGDRVFSDEAGVRLSKNKELLIPQSMLSGFRDLGTKEFELKAGCSIDPSVVISNNGDERGIHLIDENGNAVFIPARLIEWTGKLTEFVLG